MPHELQDTMTECFNGRAENRSCDFCPAHNSKGGPCCFGRKYANDGECGSCVHKLGCFNEFNGLSKQRIIPTGSASNIPLRPSNVTPIPMNSAYAQPTVAPINSTQFAGISNQFLPQTHSASPQMPSMIMQFSMPKREPIPFDKDSSLAEKLSIMTGWGMLEGGLEMALYTFRKHRPE